MFHKERHFVAAPEDIIEKDAKHTAAVLNFFDKLFDTLNSSKRFDFLKPLKSAVHQDSEHITFWRESIKHIRSMYFLKTGQKFIPPTLKHWVVTVESVIKLWNTLKEKGCMYLLTRRVNQH